jgi:hypothetical protein
LKSPDAAKLFMTKAGPFARKTRAGNVSETCADPAGTVLLAEDLSRYETVDGENRLDVSELIY